MGNVWNHRLPLVQSRCLHPRFVQVEAVSLERLCHFHQGRGIFSSLFPCDNPSYNIIIPVFSHNGVHDDNYNCLYPANPMQVVAPNFTRRFFHEHAADSSFSREQRFSCTDVVLRYTQEEDDAEIYNLFSNNPENLASVCSGAQEEDETFNADQPILDCIEEEGDDNDDDGGGDEATYNFAETNDEFFNNPEMRASSWILAREEDEAIDGAETNDELTDCPDQLTSDWVEGQEDDEALMSYVADWEDPYNQTVEEEEGLSWYVTEEDGYWVAFPLTDGSLSEETILKNLKKRVSKANTDEHEMCMVCLDSLFQEEENIASLQCGHEYHVGCIKNWLTEKNCCPLCKAVGIAGN